MKRIIMVTFEADDEELVRATEDHISDKIHDAISYAGGHPLFDKDGETTGVISLNFTVITVTSLTED